MTTKLYAVYGASGCGRGIMPLVRKQHAETSVDNAEFVFVDDNPPAKVLNGHKVLTYAEFLQRSAVKKYAALAIANSVIREKLADKIQQDGILPLSVQAQNVVTMDEVEIAEGALLSPFVTLTSNIKIGRFFHANLYSYVEHDCVIGDFVTFAPGVKCNGNIIIEDHAYIGTGAVIKQGTPDKPLRIGKGAVVGMAAVVTKDVPAGVTVVGNPARLLIKN